MSAYFQGKQVLIMSAFAPGSGYGADGISLAQHVEAAGAFAHLDPSAVGVPLPLDVAKMLARPRPDHFDLMLQHADPQSLQMHPYVQERVGRTLAWTMWEFGSVHGEAFEADLAANLSGFDDLYGYTHLTSEVLAPYAPDARHTTLMGGFESVLWKPNPEIDPVRDWDGPFRFGLVVTNARKNALTALTAFHLVKGEHPDYEMELHFKTNGLFVPPMIHDPSEGIYVHHVGWTHKQMRDFFATLNCLICPSMGEGKSLPPMEAGTMGCPSILSKCAGHIDWANSEIAWLVDGETRERDAVRLPGQTAFYIDVEQLARAMIQAYEDRAEARQKGQRAADYIPAALDWDKVIERLDFQLAETPTRTRPGGSFYEDDEPAADVLAAYQAGSSADT